MTRTRGNFYSPREVSVQCLEKLPSGIIPKLHSKLNLIGPKFLLLREKGTLYIIKMNISDFVLLSKRNPFKTLAQFIVK